MSDQNSDNESQNTLRESEPTDEAFHMPGVFTTEFSILVGPQVCRLTMYENGASAKHLRFAAVVPNESLIDLKEIVEGAIRAVSDISNRSSNSDHEG